MRKTMLRREADDPEFPVHVADRGPNLRCERCGCVMADDGYARCQLCESLRPLRDRILEIALRNRDVNGYNCDCHDEIASIFEVPVAGEAVERGEGTGGVADVLELHRLASRAATPAVSPVPVVTDEDVAQLQSHLKSSFLISYGTARRLLALCEWARARQTGEVGQ